MSINLAILRHQLTAQIRHAVDSRFCDTATAIDFLFALHLALETLMHEVANDVNDASSMHPMSSREHALKAARASRSLGSSDQRGDDGPGFA